MGVDISPTLIRKLSAWFYPMNRRDDGLWHIIRDPQQYAAIWNGVVVGTAANVNSVDLRNPVSNFGIPNNAKGVLFSIQINSATAGAFVCIGPNDGIAVGSRWLRPCRIEVANASDSGFAVSLFGAPAGVINGSISARAFVGNCTTWINVFGWIA